MKLPSVKMVWRHEAGELIGDEVYDVAKKLLGKLYIYIYYISCIIIILNGHDSL